MESRGLSIRGCDPNQLADALRGRNYVLVFSSDRFFVLCMERYYFRASSKLMAVAILDFDDGLCNVRVVAGGGKDFLGISWGAEKSLSHRVIKDLEEVCKQKGWQTTTQQQKEKTYDSGIIRKG
ncbi:MAG: hypothetical protein JW778_03625 [Candidatus Altiarchaeota archaeon]|nr:hypothetical protein [Candidatus Altiarchaeota archaeon]